jgi:cell division transport system permease protein
MLGRLSYVLRETWASFRRNMTLTIAAIITSAVALLIFGLTSFVQKGFDNLVSVWEGGVEVIVFVNPEAADDDTTNEQALADARRILEENLDQQPIVERYDYCDTGCTVDLVETLYAGDPSTRELLLSLDPARLPTSYKIIPVEDTGSADLETLVTTLRGMAQVQNVQYAADVIDVVTKVKNFVGLYTLILSILLLLAAILLIWNTIRTAMFARRREIEVMKLVGATDWFIRVPFMLEGLIQGLVGAMGACGALWLINNRWTAGVRGFPENSGFAAMVIDSGFQTERMLIILVIGMLAGAIGSGIAASRFLDV